MQKKIEHKLPNMEKKFSIQVKGEESKLVWAGDFIYKRPTLKERGMADVMRIATAGQGPQIAWPALLRKLDRMDPSYKS